MKKKILIIEDEKHISNLLKFILEKEGFEIYQAFLGDEGVAMCIEIKPSLVLLDVMMPKKDGFEVAQIMKAKVETKNIPILMLSSAAQAKDKVKGLKCGAQEYITKPFEKKNLLNRIRNCIK